ncbi:sugar transferase [candidate division TA06 bacterium]|nr:sugar transferase [candidate division TA06 bacterium]
MILEKARTLHGINLLLDLLSIPLTFYLAYYMRSWLPHFSPDRVIPFTRVAWIIPIILPLWAFLLHYEGCYFSLKREPFQKIAWNVAKAVAEGLAVILAFLFITRGLLQSRLALLLFGLFNTLSLLLIRASILGVQRYLISRGTNFQEVLIVGTGERGRDFSKFIRDHQEWGFRVKGHVALNEERRGSVELPPLGELKNLGEILHHQHVDWVVFALSKNHMDQIEEGVRICEEMGIPASYMLSDLFPTKIAKTRLDLYEGMPLLTFSTTPSLHWALFLKGILDRIASLIFLLITLPLFPLFALMIRLTSKGPVFFKQERCGLNGRRFTLYKFRTMLDQVEPLQKDSDLPIAYKLRKDPRVTRVGRFLRKLSLDELPQLINILKGEMSFVGPRPPLPSEVERYEKWQKRRLSMKPGLTCVWQVKGRNEIHFNEWMELDLEYIDTWSLSLDFKILMKTIPAVFSGRGAY